MIFIADDGIDSDHGSMYTPMWAWVMVTVGCAIVGVASTILIILVLFGR